MLYNVQLKPEWPQLIVTLAYVTLQTSDNIDDNEEELKKICMEGDIDLAKPSLNIANELAENAQVFVFRADRIYNTFQLVSALLDSLNAIQIGKPRMAWFRVEVLARLSAVWNMAKSTEFYKPVAAQPVVMMAISHDEGTNERVIRDQLLRLKQNIKNTDRLSELSLLLDLENLPKDADTNAIKIHYGIENSSELDLCGGLEAAIVTRLVSKNV